MNKLMMPVLLVFSCILTCEAQEEGYRVSGKIDGMPDGILLLVSDETGRAETLGSTTLTNGTFVFTGSVATPVAAYITTPDNKGYIPIILENASFMINAGKNGVLVKGGPLQDIYNQFSKINVDLLNVQNRVQIEYQAASREKDSGRMTALQQQLEDALENALRLEKELLQKYADSYVAAYVVFSGMHQLDENQLKEKYALLGENVKATIPGRAIAAFLEEMADLTEGNIAPDFTVVTTQGDSLSMYPVKGKLKLVHFWDIDNPACRSVNVEILALYQKYHMRGLEVISVATGTDRQNWMKIVVEDGMIWKNGLDSKAVAIRRYHVRNFPYTVLLDEENHIIAKGLQGKALQKKVGEELKKK